jgi:hypothetical protein
MADGKGAPRLAADFPAAAFTREIRFRKFPGLRVPKNGLETGFILMSAIPAEAGRSSPHAVFISSPGPVSLTSRHWQRAAT